MVKKINNHLRVFFRFFFFLFIGLLFPFFFFFGGVSHGVGGGDSLVWICSSETNRDHRRDMGFFLSFSLFSFL